MTIRSRKRHRAPAKRRRPLPKTVHQQWIGEPHEIDYNTQRPTIRIDPQRGRVRLRGQKPGSDAVNFSSRKKGVLDDEETGQPSEIKEVVYAG